MPHLNRITLYPAKSIDGLDVSKARSSYDPANRILTLNSPDQKSLAPFQVDKHREALHRRFSNHFGFSVSLVEDSKYGFPGDKAAPGPTVLADLALLALAREFPRIGLDEFRHRFRANLLIAGVDPFGTTGFAPTPAQSSGFGSAASFSKGPTPASAAWCPPNQA